jgi:uncharacterized iron-regulated protein
VRSAVSPPPRAAVLGSALLLVAALGCGGGPSPRLVNAPIGADRPWVSEEDRSHPLVGRIWDARAETFLDEGALSARAAAADFVLLGEVHDNPDHHLLQARLVRAVTAAGKRPALLFEHLDEDVQEKVDGAVARRPRDPDAIGEAVEWEKSGWYAFSMFRPIFAAGLDAGLPIVAANLPRKIAKHVVVKGADALSPELRARLAGAEPLPDDVVRGLREEMKRSHCDAPLPEPFLDKLALAQRARDAQMAGRMRERGAGRGAVLVTGNGHARTDRGVPAFLAREAPGRAVVSIAFLEVSEGWRAPGEYAADFGAAALPFDLVVFTPRTEREDPCEDLRGHDWSKAKPGADGKDPAPAPGGAPPAAPAETPR